MKSTFLVLEFWDSADLTGNQTERCAVYFREEDIAVVNLDRNVRVSLFKYEEGYSDYYTSLWNKVRKRYDR